MFSIKKYPALYGQMALSLVFVSITANSHQLTFFVSLIVTKARSYCLIRNER